MENVPSGVTISPGVASPVVVSTATTEAPRVGSEVPQLYESVTELPLAEDKAQEIISEQDTASFTESIETIAKTEGVDTAFENLAAEELSESQTVHEKPISDEKDPVRIEVETLNQRVEQLSVQNEALTKRVEKVEAINTIAAVSAYELALILKKLIEEEELNKQKKETLLEALAKLMAKLLTLILVDEPRDNQGRSNQEKVAA